MTDVSQPIAAGTRLADQLEVVSEKSLKWLKEVLDRPIDEENSALLRAQSSAANIALNTQLRADALRLRAQRNDNALKTLIELIAAKEQSVPSVMNGSCIVTNELLGPSLGPSNG